MLSGPLGGLLFSRRSLMYIKTWTSTSTSQVKRRQRNLSLQIILKNRVLLLKPIPPLHLLFLLLTLKFQYLSLPFGCRHLYFSFMYTCFLLLGLRPKSHVAFPLININFFFFIVCVSVRIFCASFFFFFFFFLFF